MKFLTFRLLVTILTFAFGTLCVWIALHKYSFEQSHEGSQSKSNLAERIKTDFKSEKFIFLGHACGRGWIDGYELENGQRLSTGLNIFPSSKEAKKALSEFLAKSKRIVTTFEDYKKLNSEKVNRVVVEFVSEKTGENYVAILDYRKDANSYSYIYAPTVELALELEEYLKKP